MAILIPMTLVGNDEEAAAYDASTSRGRVRLRIAKASGAIEVVAAESDLDAATEFVVSRVSRVLRALWERDEYPAETDYRH